MMAKTTRNRRTQKQRGKLILCLLAACCLLAWNRSVNAEQRTWVGTGSTDWHAATNWAPVGVPGPNDTASVSGAGFALTAGPVSLSELEVLNGAFVGTNDTLNTSGSLTVRGVDSRLSAGGDINALLSTVDNGGEMTFANRTFTSSTLTVGAGSVVNGSGTINLNAPNGIDRIDLSGTIAAINGSTLTLTGGDMFNGDDTGFIDALLGNIVVDARPALANDTGVHFRVADGRRLSFPQGWSTRNSERITLNGASELNALTFNNSGRTEIAAGGSTVTIDAATTSFVGNHGTIDVSSGTARFVAPVSNSLSGTLNVSDGSTLLLEQGANSRGLVQIGATAGDTGQIVGGQLLLENGTGELRGVGRIGNQLLSNRGIIFATGSASETLLIDTVEPFDPDGVTNVGEISVDGSSLLISPSASQPVSVFHSTMSLSHGGKYVMETGQLVLASEGSIDMETNGELVASSLSLAGTLRLGNSGGSLDADVAFADGSTIDFDGLNADLLLKRSSTVNVGANILHQPDSRLVVAETGSLNTEPGVSIPVAVENNGTLAPGLTAGTSTGLLSLGSDYSQADLGKLEITIAGTAAGDFDVLDIAGTAILDGAITANLLGGYVPQVGDAFDVMTAQLIAGTFDNSFIPLSGGLRLDVIQNTTSISLEVSQALLGPDLDGDGVVDVADVDSLVAQIAAGTNAAPFDLTGDASVDQADLSEWLVQAGSINLPSGAAYIVGDANLDGTVDGQDFLRWNTNKFTLTAAWSAGDFSADGSVDGQDFLLWNGNKFTSADAMMNAVPEPNLGLFVGYGLVLATMLKRSCR